MLGTFGMVVTRQHHIYDILIFYNYPACKVFLFYIYIPMKVPEDFAEINVKLWSIICIPIELLINY